MSLTVLSVAYPLAPVGPEAVGGAEQVLGEIDQALVSRGHTSLVVACEGSKPAGTLFPVKAPTRFFDCIDHSWSMRVQAALDAAIASHPIDLIHMHGMDFYRYKLPRHIPTLVTLHMPIAWYPAQIWQGRCDNVQFQCVSYSQRSTCPPSHSQIPVVPNGVALPPPNERANDDFAIALGRICPEKNFHAALSAGTLAKTRVVLCGRVFPYTAHQNYFREKVWPMVCDEGAVHHSFLGAVGPRRKHRLLQRAKCLLLPTRAPETSSLVAMEALAAGTPVIAYRSGAIPDIVEDGVTGFLVDSVEAMAQAIRRVDALDRRLCRRAAERRFSRDQMIRGYLHLYQQHISACSEINEKRE